MHQFVPDQGICFPQGFLASGTTAGIKISGKPDLGILFSEAPAACFGAFTRNKVQAAPVKIDDQKLRTDSIISAIIVNSGNANACTGDIGLKNAHEICQSTAKGLGVSEKSVLICSTGIIGHQLPMDIIRPALPGLCAQVRTAGGPDFTAAIMTTDTKVKEHAVSLMTELGEVRVGGCSKGSGMIHPDMATMLAFVTTDIELPVEFKAEFTAMINESFNAISVDGDTSTNDSAFLMSSKKTGIHYSNLGLTDQGNFRHALFSVFESLARKIVLDGEGATKFVEIAVEGARSREMAKNVGRFVGNSSLVKTAIFGQDPNWGRILSSAGSSGEDIDGDAIDIWLDNVPVVRQSMALHYDRAQLKEIVSRDTYQIRINLNIGDAGFKVWISDLSYEYVRINAEYST